jgi:hypothetical protein
MLALFRSKFVPFLVPRGANDAESGEQPEEDQFVVEHAQPVDLIEIDQPVDITIEAAPPLAVIEINQAIDPAAPEQPIYVAKTEQFETHQHIGAVNTAPSVDLAETALPPENVVEQAQPADISELAQATAASIARTLESSRRLDEILARPIGWSHHNSVREQVNLPQALLGDPRRQRGTCGPNP